MPPNRTEGGWRVGRQKWRDLLFLHQAVPIEALRRLVPHRLEIDTFEGTAWATLIPFAVFDSRPLGVPRRLAMDFLEVNLRTYVRSPAGEAGIYFFSLEASSWLAVAGARAGYALPYFPAAMARHTDADGARIDYRSRRRGPGPTAGLDVVWSVGPPAGAAAPGSLDYFLIERYVLFAARGERLYRAQVRHQSYPLRRAFLESLRESLFARAGLPGLSAAPLLHHSPGVDVEICWRRRLH